MLSFAKGNGFANPAVLAGLAAGLILVRQEEGGGAAVGLGDDPQRVLAPALARLGLVDGVGGQQPAAMLKGLVVRGLVLDIDTAPITLHVPAEAFKDVARPASLHGSWRGVNVAGIERTLSGV